MSCVSDDNSNGVFNRWIWKGVRQGGRGKGERETCGGIEMKWKGRGNDWCGIILQCPMHMHVSFDLGVYIYVMTGKRWILYLLG